MRKTMPEWCFYLLIPGGIVLFVLSIIFLIPEDLQITVSAPKKHPALVQCETMCGQIGKTVSGFGSGLFSGMSCGCSEKRLEEK